MCSSDLLPAREAAFATFMEGAPALHRSRVLAGVPLSGAPDEGPMICACHAVGRVKIEQAVAAMGEPSVEAIGAATKAGTNCGSCRPEIARLIAARD